ncbi:MAG: hypothetical protein HYW34_00825 [Candidatus Brennerbacteria bacterium]|nr:hypothetical protein [Candidatus Brennerbacteria bacterium]
MSEQQKMSNGVNKKIITSIIIIGAIILGYFLGAGNKPVVPLSSPDHQEAGNARIPGAHHIHALAYNYDGNLLLGAHGGLFESKNRGKTFEKIQTKGSVNADDWMSIVSHPQNRKILFAGGHDLGVIKSEDGGVTWMRADEGIKGTDIHGLAINQRNPNWLFAYSVDNGVFRSKDGGVSWKRMDDGPDNPGVRSFAYMAVQTSMDKSMGWDNWGLLFAGTADGVYQSFSCFCGWTKTTDVFNNTTVYTLAALHKDLEIMYAGTKDGIWKSGDEGGSWENLNGLKGLKIAAIAINPDNSQEITASTEDGVVYQSNDAGDSWQQMN